MLREKVIKGGVMLSLRSGATLVLAFVTTLVLARLISPESFGTYALILSITTFLGGIGPVSLRTYLVRLGHEPSERDLRVSFSLLMLVALVNSAVSLAVFGFLDWRTPRGLTELSLIGLASLNVSLISCVPLSLLERALDYKRISVLDVASKAISSTVSVGLAFMGYGVAALLYGGLVSNLFLAFFLFYFRPVRLGFDLMPSTLRQIGAFVSSFSVVALLWNLQGVATSSLLAGLVSLEALGYVKIAQSVHNRLAFSQDIILRISTGALAKVQGHTKLIGLVGESMLYSFLLTTPLYFIFAGTGYWVIPRLFGSQWAPASPVFLVWVLVAALQAVFNPMENLFIVKGYNSIVIKFRFSILLLSCMALVPAAGLFGPLGLPLAELVACACYFYLYAKFTEVFGPVRQGLTGVLLAFTYTVTLVAYMLSNIFYSAVLLLVAYAAILLGSQKAQHMLLGAFGAVFKGWRSGLKGPQNEP